MRTPSTSPTIRFASTCSVKVWDIAIRLYHWPLIILIYLSWWTYETGQMNLHKLSGYCILTLALFRILWGFFGSENARFGQFLRGPSAVCSHLRHLAQREADTELGHNPAGGWAVVLLLLLLLIQATSGLFADDDILTKGPLARYVSEDTSSKLTSLHAFNFNLLLAVIILHVLAVVLYRIVKGQNLVLPMISGNKTVPTGSALRPPHHASPARALVLFLLAGGIVTAIACLG